MQSRGNARKLAVTLMWAQAGVVLIGLTVKIFIILTGRIVSWELSILPPVSIFVLASVLLPPILALSILRDKRWGESGAIIVESAVAIYSTITVIGKMNASQLFSLAISVAIIYLLIVRRGDKVNVSR